MGETDTPDFNKARGYLLGFSTVVLLLWYFGADLSAFKLLGNEIKLKENVKNVWLVLAGINFYLWLRLYQRTPAGSFRFDLPMHDLYEKTLIHVMRYVERKNLRHHALRLVNDAASVSGGECTLQKFKATGKMTCYGIAPRKNMEKLEQIRSFDSLDRNEVRFAFFVDYTTANSHHSMHSPKGCTVSPSRLVTNLVKWYVFVRGALVSPWFFDHVTPFVLGGVSTCVALLSWWQINYPQV